MRTPAGAAVAAFSVVMLTLTSPAAAADEIEGASELSPATAPTPTPKPKVQVTTGIVHVRPSLKAERVDGEHVRVAAPGELVVSCGRHRIERLVLDVPCGGEVDYDVTQSVGFVAKMEDTRERRSNGLLAGGIVIASLGLVTTLVGVMIAGLTTTSCSPGNVEQQKYCGTSPAATSTIIVGLSGVLLGIPLAIYGGQRVEP